MLWINDIRRILLCACALGALLRAGAAEPKVRFVPQPDLKISGFWADRLDKLESAWIPHCWKRLGVRSGAFQRNLAEATMMALERHPDRKDLADILARFVASDVAAQRPDGYVGKYDPHYVDYMGSAKIPRSSANPSTFQFFYRKIF